MTRARVVSVMLVVEAVGLLALQPLYERMFDDFGVRLPVFTRVMLVPLVPVAVVLFALAVVSRYPSAAIGLGVLLGLGFLLSVVFVDLPLAGAQ